MNISRISKSLGLVASLALFAGFTGCVEHQSALCTEDNGIEIAGLEGTKSFRTLTESGEIAEMEIQFAYKGQGHYLINDSKSQACALGSHMALETQNESGGYRLIFVEALGTKGFYLSGAMASPRELDAAGIPYEVLESPETEMGFGFQASQLLADFSEGEEISLSQIKILNSTEEHNKALRHLLLPSSVGFALR